MDRRVRVWRICKEVHAKDAFTGEGSRRFSGRWHRAGTPIVYTATSIALAALEVFVHLEPEFAPDPLIVLRAELPVDETKCERIRIEDLPNDWRREAHPELEAMGTQWAVSERSLALYVPSAVIDGEWNVLLNPAHPLARKITFEGPRPFQFDERMFKRLSR